MLENTVFDRHHGVDTMSELAYYSLIGITLFYGFGINWLTVPNVPYDAIPMLQLIIGYFILAFAETMISIAGIMFSIKSKNPLISFVEYNLFVIPVVFVMNVSLQQYNPTVIINAIMVTAIVTGIMMIMRVIFLAIFRGRSLSGYYQSLSQSTLN